MRALLRLVQDDTVHFRITLLPDRHVELIELREGESLEQALDDFMSRKGRFAGEWVPIGASGRYVRYDQIVQVEGKLD